MKGLCILHIKYCCPQSVKSQSNFEKETHAVFDTDIKFIYEKWRIYLLSRANHGKLGPL